MSSGVKMKLISKFLLTSFVRGQCSRPYNKDDIAAGVSAAYQRTQADKKTLDPLTEARKYWDAVSKVAPGGTPMERGRLAYGGAFGTEPPSNFYSDMVQSNRAINDYSGLRRNAYWCWYSGYGRNQGFGY